MTYLELYERANRMLDNNEINLGEYEKMIKPLEAEVARWIPCSERVPEDILCGTLVTDGMNVWVETWVGIVGKWKYNHSTITAWMPLPEPYEERREADATN